MRNTARRTENEHWQIPDNPPHVMIQQFMLDRGLRQADLGPVLGSRSLVSEGRQRQAKAKQTAGKESRRVLRSLATVVSLA